MHAEKTEILRKSVTEKDVTGVRKMLDEDRQVKYHKIEEILDLNEPLILSVLKNYLHVTKLYRLRLPYSLIENQKTRRVKCC